MLLGNHRNLSTALDPDELEGYHVIVNNQERATVGPDASSYYLYGLSNNTVYSYQVKAILANGSEPLYSDVVAATTLNRTAPNSPDIPTKVTVSGGFVQVSVETPHDTGGVALSNVTVVVSDIYGVVTSQTLSVTSSGVLVFNSYGLNARTKYWISAFATNEGDLVSSNSDPLVITTTALQLPGPCPPPTVVKATGAFGMADTNYNADKDGIINTVVRRSNGTSGAVEVGVHVTGPDTVFLRCKRATSGGCDCTLYLISSESVPLPCYLSFVDGQENASVAFSMWDDQSAELLPSQVVVSPFGVDLSGQHSAVLHMDARQEAGFVSFPASSSVIYEDSSFVMINVLRLNGTTGRVTFSFESFDITAVTGEDYVAVSGTIVLTDQQSSTQIWVQLIDNLVVNSDKVFGLRLTGQTELTGADQLLTHNVTIHDDESISSAVPRKTDNISIVYSTGGEFEIGWTSTASDGVNVTGYLVRVSNASLGTFYSVFNTTQTIFTLSGLSARSIYLVEVAVWNHFGVGEYSDAVEVATTDATLPSSRFR
ncbi:histone-lysine N-methyltransferase CG1716 [Phytophthora nicotianae]|uniref:Histone-lysine N-methyltransferase CG1716 n=1 Tax=Phytophthora nicotianae TaxID=4792 RepID=A0A0W8DPH3_PHYNI|nr:histone-lysine N-methyltransferase CG1716 [Phytophthora nicotianae]